MLKTLDQMQAILMARSPKAHCKDDKLLPNVFFPSHFFNILIRIITCGRTPPLQQSQQSKPPNLTGGHSQTHTSPVNTQPQPKDQGQTHSEATTMTDPQSGDWSPLKYGNHKGGGHHSATLSGAAPHINKTSTTTGRAMRYTHPQPPTTLHPPAHRSQKGL